MLEKKNHGFCQMIAGFHELGVEERRRYAGFCLLLMVLVGAFLLPLPEAGELWVRHGLDALHLPAFFVITVLCFRLLDPFLKDTRRMVWAGVIGAVVLAGLIEIFQGFFGRTPDLRDAVLGCVGAGLAGLYGRMRSRVFIMVASVSSVFAVSPLVEEIAALHWRETQFPVLGDFSSRRSALLWHAQGGASVQTLPGSDPGLEVRTAEGEWSGVSLRVGGGSWADFRTLEITVHNPGAPIYLGVRVDDADGRIYQDGFQVPHGNTKLEISVPEILATAESFNPRVYRMALFVAPDQQAVTFRVRYARLVE